MQHLEGDRPVVAEVVGEVDRGHAAAAELAFDRVAVAQGLGERGGEGGHSYFPATSRSKRGLPRSGAKFGSIRSQPGESVRTGS